MIDGLEIAHYEHAVAPEILGSLQLGRASSSSQSGGWQGGGRGGGGGGGMGGRHGGGRQRSSDQSSGQAPAQAGRPLQGAAPYSLLGQTEPVAAADADLDGKVTLQEFLAAADRHFDQLDGARAGFLTLAALPKTPVQRMARRSRAPDD